MDLDVPKIARLLDKDPTLLKNWRQIYDEFKLPPAVALTLTRLLNNGNITSYELLSDVLQNWKSANGKEATTDKLENVLRNLGFVNAAGEKFQTNYWEVKLIYKITERIAECSGQITLLNGSLKFPVKHNYEEVVAKYVDRPHFEDEILAALSDNLNVKCPLKCPVVVLHGIGGVGKTTLARKICQMADIYFNENCIWINAENEEILLNDFASLFGILDINKDKIQQTLKNCYNSQLKEKKCLFVFDNVDDYKILLPFWPLNLETKISVLITANTIWDSLDYGEIQHIPVDKFNAEEFSKFVNKIIPNITESEIRALNEYTGRIPYLANIVCFGFFKWRKYRPSGKINEYLNVNDDKLLSGGVNLGLSYLMYKKSPEKIVGRQVNLMIQDNGQEGAEAYKTLCILAYCRSDFEGLDLIEFLKIFAISNVLKISDSEVVIRILIDHGFLERRTTIGKKSVKSWILNIHRSHQKAIRTILWEEKKEEQQIEYFLLLNRYSSIQMMMDFTVIWSRGRKYGDTMFAKMIDSQDFLPNMMKDSSNENGVKELISYAKKTKSRSEYARYIIFKRSSGDKLSLLGSFRRRYSDITTVEDFNDFFEELKAYNGPDIRNTLKTFIISIAFKRKEWLDLTFRTFYHLHRLNIFQELFLCRAITNSNLMPLEYLIENGININIKVYGCYPLYYAVEYGWFECTEVLLNNDADPHVRDDEGNTLLHLSAKRGHTKLVKLLLSKNVDRKIKNYHGELALKIAQKEGEIEIVQLLQAN